MTIYTVTIHRDVCLTYEGIEADSREEAQEIAICKPMDAAEIDEGEISVVLVDEQDDEAGETADPEEA
jgi:hypothetical protein